MIFVSSISGLFAGAIVPLIIAWWSHRRKSKSDVVIGDREDASLYLKFKTEIETMESRLATKYQDEMAKVEARYKREIAELRSQVERDRAAVDFLAEHVDPAIAKVARQIQAGEYLKA